MNYEDFLSGQSFVMNRGRIEWTLIVSEGHENCYEEAVSKNLPDIAKTQGFLLRV